MDPTASLRVAQALVHALTIPIVPPLYSSPDGLPENDADLERADDALLEAVADARGDVTLSDLVIALHECWDQQLGATV